MANKRMRKLSCALAMAALTRLNQGLTISMLHTMPIIT